MSDLFVTSFGLGPELECIGTMCLTLAAYLAARRLKSALLYLAAIGFLVCAFTIVLAIAMPIQFSGNVWPPHWVSWLAMIGMPIAELVAGVAALAFVVLRVRTRS